MLWYILYLPYAEPLKGTGNVSASNGIFEHFYTDIALFTSKKHAQSCLDCYFEFKTNEQYKYSAIKEHYEILPYEN